MFPTIPDYICHFHFLRDIGKDLFDFEYRTIRRYIREFKTKATLSQAEKTLHEAIDNEPVDLLFALLVPDEATQQHLDILAGVARLFSQGEFCLALREASSDEALYAVATEWTR